LLANAGGRCSSRCNTTWPRRGFPSIDSNHLSICRAGGSTCRSSRVRCRPIHRRPTEFRPVLFVIVYSLPTYLFERTVAHGSFSFTTDLAQARLFLRSTDFVFAFLSTNSFKFLFSKRPIVRVLLLLIHSPDDQRSQSVLAISSNVLSKFVVCIILTYCFCPLTHVHHRCISIAFVLFFLYFACVLQFSSFCSESNDKLRNCSRELNCS